MSILTSSSAVSWPRWFLFATSDELDLRQEPDRVDPVIVETVVAALPLAPLLGVDDGGEDAEVVAVAEGGGGGGADGIRFIPTADDILDAVGTKEVPAKWLSHFLGIVKVSSKQAYNLFTFVRYAGLPLYIHILRKRQYLC